MDKPSQTPLLPCPFCGEKAHMARRTDEDGCLWAHIECKASGTHEWVRAGNDDPMFYQSVRDNWNRRSPVLPAQWREEAPTKDAGAEVEALIERAKDFPYFVAWKGDAHVWELLRDAIDLAARLAGKA